MSTDAPRRVALGVSVVGDSPSVSPAGALWHLIVRYWLEVRPRLARGHIVVCAGYPLDSIEQAATSGNGLVRLILSLATVLLPRPDLKVRASQPAQEGGPFAAACSADDGRDLISIDLGQMSAAEAAAVIINKLSATKAAGAR